MLKFTVDYPEEQSRLQLLVRTFFGPLYIMFPHLFVLLFVLLWLKLVWVYTTFYILIKGDYPLKTKAFTLGVLSWLARLHLTAYNLRDEYPRFGVHSKVPYMNLELKNDSPPNRLLVLVRFLLTGWIILPHLFIWVFRNFWSSVLAFMAFWVVLFTGKYPRNWHDFNIGTLRWLLRVIGYQLYLFDEYPEFSGK